jgi:RNA polymerase sigma factor (sigma-70 family)
MVASLRAQNPAVARPLWQWFAPPISRLLRCTLGPRVPIDDAIQVVLLCVFRRGRRLRPDSDLRQFVLKTTARIAQAELRRGRKFRRLTPSGRPAEQEREAVMRFYRILDQLSPPDRIAFVFHHIEGMELREVAGAIGEAPARTRRRLHRSVGKIIAGIERDPLLAPLQRSGSA